MGFVFPAVKGVDPGMICGFPSPNGRMVEWYDRLPILHPAPHGTWKAFHADEKDGHGRGARPDEDI